MSFIYLPKYDYLQKFMLTDNEIVLKTFECEFGDRPVTTKERLDFANNLSKNSKFSKKFILDVLKVRKN